MIGCIIAVVSCGPGDAPEPHALPPKAPQVPGAEVAPPQPATAEPAHSDDGPQPRSTKASPSELVRAEIERDSSVRRSNHCEGLQVRIDDQGRQRYKRVRRPWTEADRNRFAKLVTMVAKEMGAEPRLIRTWALRESTYRPHAMHVLDPDVEAASAAWQRFHYSAEEEAQLQAVMDRVTAQDPEYWQAKARLHQVQTFRDNPYLDDLVELEVVSADGSRSPATEPAWAFGYGPFGFNPAYFVPVWDSTSPPWVFCDDDGLVAIITAVWAARTAQRECEAQGFGGSYAAVNRRFSQGHCGPVSERARFRGRARRAGLDPDARARLGRKWPRKGTDRGQMLQLMRHKAVAAGLLGSRARPPGVSAVASAGA
ncbi:MAG: hypothetical protein AB1Z98_24990 [Nannocystaceae bacterium]